MGHLSNSKVKIKGGDLTVFTGVLRLENKKLFLNKNFYSFPELLAEINGFSGFFFCLFSLIAILINRTIYINSVFGKLF